MEAHVHIHVYLVMDPLLWQLQASDLCLTVNSFYAGGFLQADDIRTLATSEESMKSQVALVKAFAEDNLLRLNVSRLCSSPGTGMSHSLHVWLKGQYCQQVMSQSVWASGGGRSFGYEVCPCEHPESSKCLPPLPLWQHWCLPG